MARSKIEWLARTGTIPESWNPVTGCTKISPGCKHCYAERMSKRLRGRAGYPYDDPFAVTLHPDKLDVPLKWRKPRTVFVCSMSDFFHPEIPFAFQCGILQMIGKCPQHTFMILTKRVDQLEMWEHAAGWHPYPNLWLGVTAENQEQADKRISVLLQIPSVVRFVSVEPCLERIDLGLMGTSPHSRPYALVYEKLNWVICGAETGPGARPMELAWARDLRDQCKAAGVPYFFKRTSPGTETPPDLEVREWPIT